jgi:hypothetical protein
MEVLEMRRLTGAACGLVITIGLGVLAAGGVAGTGAGGGASLITARIDERTVHFSPALHSGFVQLHIVSTGVAPHHLLFWQLHGGVSFNQFDRVDASQSGNPFKLATVIGGNGPLVPGHTMDIWIHIAKGRVAIDDIRSGGVTGFHRDLAIDRSGQNATQPKALGTVAAVAGDRFRLPPGFGRPGIWEFANQDKETHDVTIAQLAPGKTVADLIFWAKHGQHGPPPLRGADGGFGALGGNSHAWFTIGHLPPGNYAVACFISGANGIPDVAMGMAAGFTVR